jgi:hypothetical protein
LSEQTSPPLPAGQVQEQSTMAECDPARSLIGKWNQIDSLPGYSVDFSSNGTFAYNSNGMVAVFNRTTRAFVYDAVATSTGRWSVVADRSKEILEWKTKYPSLPLPTLPADGTILKEYFDLAPWYYQVFLKDGCKRMTQIATWIDEDPGTKYQKAQ